MQSVIEDTRAQHEEVDHLEKELTALLTSVDEHSTHRQRLAAHHRAADLVGRITSRSQSLTHFYLPENDERTREIDALVGGGAEGGDVQEFYARLGKLKDYHRKYPDVAREIVSSARTVDFAALEAGRQDWLDIKFSGEEALGRYFDLHELHEQWNNLDPPSSASAGWKRMTYIQYLANFDRFSAISPAHKVSKTYGAYLTALLNYLSSFYERVNPIGDLDAFLKHVEDEFSPRWESGDVPGWPKGTGADGASSSSSEGIWCSACQRMYSKETVYNAHLTSKKHVKAAAAQKGTDAAPAQQASTSASLGLRTDKNRAVALKEALIAAFVAAAPAEGESSEGEQGPLTQTRRDTLANTERRAALTDRERAAEIEELEAREAEEAALAAEARERAAKGEGALDMDEDDDEERIYNPLKLPLGWDGKPIPFWLYKLHGLGVEYPCEICSGYVYRGRRAFERHFQESRHAFGMRALGLPNTKHFYEITKIEDALALAKKLASEGRQEQFQSETMEELEDDEGNVFNKKTYEDLKRQGLL